MGALVRPCSLTLASANLLSLAPASKISERSRLTGVAIKGRLRQLASAFQRAPLAIISMQETGVSEHGAGKRRIPLYLAILSEPQVPSREGGCALRLRAGAPIFLNSKGVPS